MTYAGMSVAIKDAVKLRHKQGHIRVGRQNKQSCGDDMALRFRMSFTNSIPLKMSVRCVERLAFRKYANLIYFYF